MKLSDKNMVPIPFTKISSVSKLYTSAQNLLKIIAGEIKDD